MDAQHKLYVAVLRFCLLPSLAIYLAGCTHTRVLQAGSTNEMFEINRRAERASAAISLRTGERMQVQSLHVAPDIVTWIDHQNGEAHSASFSDLISVQFISRGRGALEGAGIGLASGIVAGALIGLVSYTPPAANCFFCFESSPGQEAFIGAILIGVPGAGLGGLMGMAGGSHIEYEMPTLGSEQ